jgi:hypothetical protein
MRMGINPPAPDPNFLPVRRFAAHNSRTPSLFVGRGQFGMVSRGRYDGGMSETALVPLIFAGLIGMTVLIVGVIALKYARAQESHRQEAIVRYRRGIELYENAQKLQAESQKLHAESNSLVRELIAELRTSRQASAPDRGFGNLQTDPRP